MLSVLVLAAAVVASFLTATLVASAEDAKLAHAKVRAKLSDEGGFGR
ncbi:MAG: hypothetical protein ACTHJ3_03545 [Pararhizobium sp.]